MNKTRLENLTDGVFAIVMTLLVIEIQVPEVHGHLDEALYELTPLFVSYFLSFAILSMFWLSNNGIHHHFMRSIDRPLIQITMLYLAFVALVPFSTHLLGSNPYDQVAVIWYGLNIFAAGTMSCVLFCYGMMSKEVEKGSYTSRMLRQATIRHAATPILTLLGIIASFLSIELAFVLYLTPVIFNILPGSLNFLERLVGYKIAGS